MRPGVPRLPSTVSQFVAVSFAAITSYWGVEETTNNSPAMAGLLVSQSNQNTESQVLCPHEDQCPGEDKDQFCARKAYKRQRTQRIQRKKREQKKTEEEESEIEKILREKWLEEQERREQKEAKDRGFTREAATSACRFFVQDVREKNQVSTLSLLANLIHSWCSKRAWTAETESTGYWSEPVTGTGWLDLAQPVWLG